ncbi:uncharacterized protein RCC_10572 [Ramularia collo-cygni]|uniref:Mitotic checkpoint regulator, MAD2B-interacting-domain-containing protein n=1 Tax=Ramularia collo-cygni TaxID=112498 RepID=A0A2D3VP72_9PEZI|nr:uncharacterized protein RCC_10572 [Ramularia collo-cygni]CZT24844.1 uncharacterized protein RCC_10572 [Ramularia collo-cygni]
MLVDYSDSDSDGETIPAPIPTPKAAPKPSFQATSGKIKVDLPSIRPDPTAAPDEPPAKKARTAGAFSGINSFLPAPKRTAAQNAPKKGVSLKTSSEAAFSREVPQYDAPMPGEGFLKDDEKKEQEVKLIGKATRFLPLSVSSKKKKKPVLPKAAPIGESSAAELETASKAQAAVPDPKPKVRKSLFSVQQEEPEEPEPVHPKENYEHPPTATTTTESAYEEPSPQPSGQSTLSTIASDLNLTAAQKRHLFGRNGKDVSITHFDMDSEYANNEKMRQAGEVTQHRAVKAVAPGKHSLQQLVNNAKTQRDGLEDAWAEGRKNRGEGSARYGWGK